MPLTLFQIALVVRDYDEAIRFFVDRLGFRIVEDTPLPRVDGRWVVVAPDGGGASVLLSRARTDEQAAAIGRQSAGRVFLFLRTEDFWRDYRAFSARGVRFVRPPRREDYGMVAVFADLYGNLWDLIGSDTGETD